MVSFTPTEDQQLLIDTLRRYALNDVRQIAHEADEESSPQLSVIKTGWQMGLVPSAIPEELGGFGEMSALTGVLAAEELAYGDLSVALHVLTPALFAYPVTLYGTAEQRETLLPLFLEESFAPATAALLEPGVFFDPYHLKTTATVSGGKVTLNGTKAYVPLADTAEWILVYASESASGETGAYIVKKDTPGVVIEKRELLMGLRALPTFRVAFNDVVLAESARLGGVVGCDVNVLLNRGRVALAAMAVGVARASFEYARDYAKERVQFGKPIAQNQAIAFMLAEMAIEVDAARLMVWEAAWKLDKGEDATKEAYLAKQYADQMVLFVTDSGVQTLGGYGFIREYPAERWLRNGRGFPTFDGLAMV
ncbi:MAG: acyl-CoA dehydrogenase family protein [Anaerolineae bacterium]|nr:acyl-CoA dehydrogenase family protein [Anaerolineae bacterium]